MEGDHASNQVEFKPDLSLQCLCCSFHRIHALFQTLGTTVGTRLFTLLRTAVPKVGHFRIGSKHRRIDIRSLDLIPDPLRFKHLAGHYLSLLPRVVRSSLIDIETEHSCRHSSTTRWRVDQVICLPNEPRPGREHFIHTRDWFPFIPSTLVRLIRPHFVASHKRIQRPFLALLLRAFFQRSTCLHLLQPEQQAAYLSC